MFVPLARSVKISRLTISNTSQRRRAALGHGLCGVGARHVARRLRALRRDRDRSADRRDVRAQSVEHGIRLARRVRRSGRAPDAAGPATGASSSAATARLERPAALRGRRRSRARRRGSRSLRRAADADSSSSRARRAEIVFLLGEAAIAGEARALHRALSSGGSRRRRSREVSASLGRACSGTVQVKTPDRAMDIMLNRWLLYQTLACRVWARAGVLSGERRVRISRSAAGRHGAACCRSRRSRASTCCAPRRGSSRRRRAALVAAADGTRCAHAHLRRSRLARVRRRALCRRDRRRRRCSTRSCRSSKGRAGGRTSTTPTSSRRSPMTAATLFEHCARGLDQQPRTRRARPAADRHRRLERRHEPGRRARARAKASGSAGFCTRRSCAFAPHRRARAASGARAARWLAHAAALRAALEREAWDGDWYRRGYFDDGTPLGSAAERRMPHRLASRNPGA